MPDRWKDIKAADHSDCSVVLSDYYTWFNCSVLKQVLEYAKTLTRKDPTDVLSNLQSYTEEVHTYCKRNIFVCPPPLWVNASLHPYGSMSLYILMDQCPSASLWVNVPLHPYGSMSLYILMGQCPSTSLWIRCRGTNNS